MKNINIPYKIDQDGYNWTLIGISNDFSKRDSFVRAEYENQYGHIKHFTSGGFAALKTGNQKKCRCHKFYKQQNSYSFCPDCGRDLCNG